jgi:hypothetical protein
MTWVVNAQARPAVASRADYLSCGCLAQGVAPTVNNDQRDKCAAAD